MALGSLLAACGTGSSQDAALSQDRHGSTGGSGSGGGGGAGGNADGAALYAASCAGCHGALATSQVRGESAGDIREAIQENEGGMGALTLTDAELVAIASALGGSGGGGGGDDDGDDGDDGDGDHGGGGDGGGGGSAEGAALYEASCAGCHGALASSQVRGESAGDIREAIQENTGGMGALTLTDAELVAIASALGSGPGEGGGGDDDGEGGGEARHGGARDLSLRASHPVALRTAWALR